MGFACMPFLPLMDEPCERAAEHIFDIIWPAEKNWVRRHTAEHAKKEH